MGSGGADQEKKLDCEKGGERMDDDDFDTCDTHSQTTTLQVMQSSKCQKRKQTLEIKLIELLHLEILPVKEIRCDLSHFECSHMRISSKQVDNH